MFSRNHRQFSQQQQQEQHWNTMPYDGLHDQRKNHSSHSYNPVMNIVRQRLWEAAAYPGPDHYSNSYRGPNVSGHQLGRIQNGDQINRVGGGIGRGHPYQQQMGGGDCPGPGAVPVGGGVGSGADQHHRRYGASGSNAAESGTDYSHISFDQRQYQQLHMPHRSYHQPIMQPQYSHNVYGGGGGRHMMYDHGGVMPTSGVYTQFQSPMYNPHMGYDPLAMGTMNGPYQIIPDMMSLANMYYSGMIPQLCNPPATMIPGYSYAMPMPYGTTLMRPHYPYYNPINSLDLERL
ncbi:hypothetical protein BX666DRAFT_697776 [Dichotomocladium elegans]|nr:hypothetical protein BX666DRAFT_697776 [Dichotomocladium elegans]